MRGIDHQQGHVFSYLSPEERVRKDHPLRAIRGMTDDCRSAGGELEQIQFLLGHRSGLSRRLPRKRTGPKVGLVVLPIPLWQPCTLGAAGSAHRSPSRAHDARLPREKQVKPRYLLACRLIRAGPREKSRSAR